MRILKLGVYPSAYLEPFYRARPQLARAEYATQHAALMYDAFGSADFWTSALAALGHETTDLVINAEPLQRAWAREHDMTWPATRWAQEIGRAQIRAFRPDVLLVADYSFVDAAFLRQVQDECPSIRQTLVWCGAPYGNADVFRACDLVLSCVPELVDDFRAQGLRAAHLHHGFAPQVLERLTPTSPSVDFTFLGSVSLASSFHRERERILAALVDETSIEIRTEVTTSSLRKRAGESARILAFDVVTKAQQLGLPISKLPLARKVARWPARPGRSATIDPRIAKRATGPLFGLAMFNRLRESRVTLNTHIDLSRRNASNMRLFEATGVGTCLLTDHKDNLPELFEPDGEVVTYDSVAECVEKVRYLLAHESDRAAIAAAGQRRTLRDHTFAHRAQQLDAILREAS
jgi:spore maturation protein CgeB